MTKQPRYQKNYDEVRKKRIIEKKKQVRTIDTEIDYFITNELLPLLCGVFDTFIKSLSKRQKDNYIRLTDIPEASSIACGVLGAMEKDIVKFAKRIKKLK